MGLDDLERHEWKRYTQNGEAGVLTALFAQVGVTNRYCVEFGCEDATECNTAFLLEQGWQGLLMDPTGVSRNPWAAVRTELVTAENVNSLFHKYGVPEEFDLLSIDIDGNDYWVWRALAYRPRVVVIEYNAHVPPTERKAIRYDRSFRWSGSDYFGASLRALAELGLHKGYTLVYCESTGTNAFFLATSLLPLGFVPWPVAVLYRPPNYLGRGLCHPPDRDRVMTDPTPELDDPALPD